MKTSILLLCLFASLAMSLSLLKGDEENFETILDAYNNGSIDELTTNYHNRKVSDVTVNGTTYRVDQIVSFSYGKIKQMVTTNDPNMPDFDIQHDFVGGTTLYYNHMTGKCHYQDITRFNLYMFFREYVIDQFEYVGNRGSMGELFKFKDKDVVGLEAMIYGTYKTDEYGQSYFSPHRLESEYNNMYRPNAVVEVVSTDRNPFVTEQTFHYSMCNIFNRDELDFKSDYFTHGTTLSLLLAIVS